jgi:hypothetical protein
MIVKDFSTFLDENGEVPLTERMRATIKFGSNWYTDIQSQELVIDRLQSALDDDFILLRNFHLPGLEVPIPITLVGPSGIEVIYTSSVKGIYQAKGELWLAMGSGARRFREAKPNLINRCLLLAQAVSRHLERFEYGNTSVDALNVFTDPGIHVDTKKPATRIVMIDALDRYIAKLSTEASLLSVETVQNIVEVLINPPAPEFGNVYDHEDSQELSAAFATTTTSSGANVTEVRLPGGRSVRFSTQQWLILGALLLANVLVLVFLLLIVLFYV